MSKFVKENFPKAKMVEPEGTYLVWVDFSGYGLSNEELEHLMLDCMNTPNRDGIDPVDCHDLSVRHCCIMAESSSDRRPLSSRDSMLPARV